MKTQSIYQGLVDGNEKLALVGLGYVGFPAAVEFAKYVKVIGFDISEKRINAYKNGIDITGEAKENLKDTTVEFTSDPTKLKNARFIIAAVPTPSKEDETPDLTFLENASEMIGKNLAAGSIVVFESTVYPGVTENVCVPLIEQASGLKCGMDWKIGYSPERISPGDEIHRFPSIRKIVSGMDRETAAEIQKVYNLAVKAGTHLVSDIKTAEAVKLIENSQRDINIAFMNEIAKICDKLNIDTNEVITGMNTKWNALGFKPGLVGGHCIGVDSYYLMEIAKKLGCSTPIVSGARRVNEGMGGYIADIAVREMEAIRKNIKKAAVVILGITFKENCTDIRNSKVIDLVNRLKFYHIEPVIADDRADSKDVEEMYGIKLVPFDRLPPADCIIAAVGHNEYRAISTERLLGMFKPCLQNSEKVLIDVKSIYSADELHASGIRFWRL